MRPVVNCHHKVGGKCDDVNRHEPIQDDSRFSAQAMRMIELICVFVFVSVLENVIFHQSVYGYLR